MLVRTPPVPATPAPSDTSRTQERGRSRRAQKRARTPRPATVRLAEEPLRYAVESLEHWLDLNA